MGGVLLGVEEGVKRRCRHAWGRSAQPLDGFIRRLKVVHRVSSSLLGPEIPSFRALSKPLKFTVRRHKFDKGSLLDGRPRAALVGAIGK